MRSRALWTAVLAALIGFVAGYRFAGFIAVDNCLDNGGAWVYEVDACDLP